MGIAGAGAYSPHSAPEPVVPAISPLVPGGCHLGAQAALLGGYAVPPFLSYAGSDGGGRMAAATLVSVSVSVSVPVPVPVALAAVLGRRLLVAGLTAGATRS